MIGASLQRARAVLAWLRRPLIGIALVVIAAAAIVDEGMFPVGGSLDQSLYDARLRAQAGRAESRVVVVDVDEASLARHGRWPWSRAAMGELLGTIADAGASVVGADIVFADTQDRAGDDEALVRRIAGRPVVLGYYFTADRGGQSSGRLPPAVLSFDSIRALGHDALSWDGYGANLAEIQSAAAGAGFFNPVVDADGVVRALPLFARYRGGVYASLAVALLRQHLGDAAIELAGDTLRIVGTRGSAVIPLSHGLTALVPFSGERRVETVSAADLLAGTVDPARLRGRIVLVGTSAPGLTDLRATPVSAAYPGVHVHATLVDAALDPAGGAFRQRSELGIAVALVVTVLLGAALALALPRVGAIGVALASAVSLLGLWVGAAIAWSNAGLVVPLAVPMLLVAALAVVNLVAGYFVEGRARRAVAGLFREYVSPALVERMMRDPRHYASPASENRELTILFVDIRGFTRIAETMQPEALREYINSFLTAMSGVVHRYGGTVDKYIGDAVMAFWGAPVPDPQHADRAVSAALAMLDEVARLNRQYEVRGVPLIQVGVGVNTGVVRVGDMGSKLRRAYTVIGDAVNLASRLEGLTKRYDAPIIVGETTMTQARSHAFSELGRARVSGRVELVRVFTPTALTGGPGRPFRHNKTEHDASEDFIDEGARLRV